MKSVEQEILLRVVEPNPDVSQAKNLHDLLSNVADVDRLIHMAIDEGVVGFLYKSLLKSGELENIGNTRKEKLRSVYYQTLLENLRLLGDLEEILKRANENGIEVVLLQGMALLEEVYEDIGLRSMSDIDLWVLDSHHAALVDLLRSMGYQGDPVYADTFRKGSTTLDLHKHLLWADRIKARRALLSQGQEIIYRASKRIRIGKQEALGLGPEDQVLYLGLHALKHNLGRLIWLVDIRYVVDEWDVADWMMLIDRARGMGQEKSLAYIIYLMHLLFNFHPPVPVSKALEKKRPNLLEAWILNLRVRKGPLPVWTPVVLLSPANGFGKRLALILETLFPRPEILRQIFMDTPASLTVWQLYWKRILQLLGLLRVSLRGY